MHSGINMHSHKHSFNMFIISLTEKMVAEVKMNRSLILWRTRSTTSYVAATFHPTIGQHAPQSLSSAATPELGMILQGIREQAGLHITKDTQNTTKPTQLGLSGHQGVGKISLLSWWAHYRAKNTYTRTILTSKTPTHTQHKESVPSLLHSPSGPAFPSSAIQGWWRRGPSL